MVASTIGSATSWFSYEELYEITNGFSPQNILGEGGFGCVYKGWIDEQSLAPSRPGSGVVVAIKKLKPEGFQGHKEWLVWSCKYTALEFFFLNVHSTCSWFLTFLTIDCRQRLTILVSFTIQTWSSWLATVRRVIIDFWSMNWCQKAAWRVIFSEVRVEKTIIYLAFFIFGDMNPCLS